MHHTDCTLRRFIYLSRICLLRTDAGYVVCARGEWWQKGTTAMRHPGYLRAMKEK